MFNISNVLIIPSQAGNGLKIKDFEIGCAIIDKIEFPEGTIQDVVKGDNLVPAMTLVAGEDGNHSLSLDYDKLSMANNFVLVKIDSEKNVTAIKSADEICDIFGLGLQDAEMLNGYIGALANDRQLVYNVGTDMDGDDFMFFTNLADAEIMEHLKNGDDVEAANLFNSILSNKDYMAEYSSRNFIKMFLIALIKACQDRFNKVNRDDVLRQVAGILGDIQYWDDGQLLKPSVLDIENYLTDIKSAIRIN